MVWFFLLFTITTAFAADHSAIRPAVSARKCATSRKQVAVDPSRDDFSRLVVAAKFAKPPATAEFQAMASHPYFLTIIQSTARKFGLDEHEEEDLFQITFIRARNGPFSSTDYPAQWVGTIAANLCRNLIRSKRARKNELTPYDEQGTDENNSPATVNIVDEAARRSYQSTQIKLQDSEKLNLVLDAIDTLPQSYREILWLEIEHHDGDLDYAAKAKLLATPISAKAYKSRLQRARRALEAVLSPPVSEEIEE